MCTGHLWRVQAAGLWNLFQPGQEELLSVKPWGQPSPTTHYPK